MYVRVELFGVLRRLAGSTHLDVMVDAPARVADVLAQLDKTGCAPLLARCACAIGEQVVGRDHTLYGSSTLVLIPPVSGG